MFFYNECSNTYTIHLHFSQYMTNTYKNANLMPFIFWFFLCAALVAVDASQQWTKPNGESLLPHIQCKSEQHNVILEESVIQLRARVMAVDDFMSILGPWDGLKSHEAQEWQGLVLLSWKTESIFLWAKLWKGVKITKKDSKKLLTYCLCISCVSVMYW